MITLGLDPSITGFGWCVHDSEADGPARVIARGRLTTTADQIFVSRYMELRETVASIMDAHPNIAAVGIESPVFHAQWTPGAYALFIYVNEVLYTRRKDVVHFDPGTLKMLAKVDPKLRKGKMFKQDMVAAARADTGIKGKMSHDEADAYHIARFTARFFLFVDGEIPVEDLTPSEYQSFAKKHTFTKGDRKGETKLIGAAFKEGKRFYRFSQLPEIK